MNRITGINRQTPRFLYHLLRWHFMHYLLRRDFPLLATFQLTNRCNFNCRMCNIRNNPRQDTLPLEAFKKIIDDLGRLGCVYATLSGGEPLLIPGIVDYAAYAASKICYVNLVTNGYLLDGTFAGKIAGSGLGSISISIDNLKEKNDALRGMPGAFDRALDAVELIKRYAPQIKITVNTVISKGNLEQLIELAKLTQRLGVLHKFQPVYKHPEFSGPQKDIGELWIGRGDIDRLRSAIDYLKNSKHVANSRYFLSCIPDYFMSDYRREIFNQDCLYPSFSCEFREDGLVYPCIAGKGWQGGYSIERGLKQAIYSSAYRKDVEGLRKCFRCRDNFSICYIESRLSIPFTNIVKYWFRKNG